MTLLSVLRHPLTGFGLAALFATAALLTDWGKLGPIIHKSGINLGFAEYPPVELGEPVAGLIYAFGPSLTGHETHLFYGSLSAPVWPAIAAVFLGLLLNGVTLLRHYRLTADIGNLLLAFGFLIGLLVVALLFVSRGEVGPGAPFLITASVLGLVTATLVLRR